METHSKAFLIVINKGGEIEEDSGKEGGKEDKKESTY